MHSLVTGGAGFIGSHLAEALLARGNRVTVVDNESTGSIANLADVLCHPRLKYHKNTVANRRLIRELVADVDEVYHLAAAVGVGLINKKTIAAVKTNINTTELLLEELSRPNRQRNIKLFLSSSSEVYGKNAKPRWSEDDDMVYGPTTCPRWSYGSSKAIDEFLALSYWRERGLPVVIGRFFNVAGPRQVGSYGMVMPRFVDAAIENRPLVVYGDGQQVRCFAHVSDIIRTIIQLMELPQAVGGVFNIGSDQPIRILELAHRVIATVDPTLVVEFASHAEVFGKDFQDCNHRIPNLARIRQMLDFQLHYDCDQIIHDVINWNRRQRDKHGHSQVVVNSSPPVVSSKTTPS